MQALIAKFLHVGLFRIFSLQLNEFDPLVAFFASRGRKGHFIFFVGATHAEEQTLVFRIDQLWVYFRVRTSIIK